MNKPVRFLTGVAAAATAGTLVLATPGLATAASYDRGDADRDRVARDADGDAESRVRATDAGRFHVKGEAEGGAPDVPLAPDDDTVARAVASLQKSVPVADGTYRVAIHFRGAQGTDRDRGDGDARADLFSTVRYGGETLRQTRNLSGDRQHKVARFVIDVPEGESGRLKLRAALRGHALAPSSGDRGWFSGSVRDVGFTVNRVND
jgi:hypothetical protein